MVFPVEELKSDFISDCVRGLAQPKQVYDYIDRWHELGKGVSVYAFLGMTIEEYAQWIENESILDSIIETRRQQNDLVTVSTTRK